MRPIALAICAALILATPAVAASKQDFNAAYAAAEKVEHQALAMQDAWTTTEKTLKEAKKAAAANDYNLATAFARKAEALAKVSVRQAQEQKTLWRREAAIIR
jgi:hypothetical protein